nr:uncharacterized protein LOC111503532 [Leptinotarsa decemlineata]
MKTFRFNSFSSVSCASLLLTIVLLVKIVCGYHEGAEKCPEEESRVRNSSKKVLWKSRSYNNAIILSIPPCQDESGNLVVRICSNRTWTPKTPAECVRTVEANRRCPANFEETSESCIFVSEAKQWEDKCNIGKIANDSYSQPLANESVWLPLRRFVEYGPYESVTWGSDFGRPLFAPSLSPDFQKDFFDKDCVILNPQEVKLEPEYCNAIHKHICEFDKREGNDLCPEGCVKASINSEKCYCKKRNCSKLAEVNSIVDKNILSDLAGNDICSVAGGKAAPLALGGSKQALGKNRWFYTKKELDCSLCSMSYTMQIIDDGKVNMDLSFDAAQRRLYLIIYSPQKIIGHGDEDTIYCFTDASFLELKKRVEVDKVHEQRNGVGDFNVYEVSLEKYKGQYWCKVFVNGNVLKSNIAVAYKEAAGFEYALRVVIKEICSISKCQVESPIRYEKFIPDDITEIFKPSYIRVMKVFYYNFMDINFLLHITSEGDNVEEEFHAFERNLKNISRKTIRVKYFRSSEFCLSETTYSKDGNLTWPLTAIGQTAIPEEICLQENGMPIYRLCKGDFLYGAQWDQVVGECLKDKKPTEDTLYLKSLLGQTLSNDTVTNVSSIIRKEPDLPVISIYYIKKLLENIYSSQRKGNFLGNEIFDSLGATANITDELLTIKVEKLAQAQMTLNVTDDILDLVDGILNETALGSGELVIHKENLIVHMCNPMDSNISGVVVYTGINGTRVENMKRNDTFDDVKYKEGFWMAVYVPEDILGYFQDGNISIITTIFFNDRFFVSNYSKKPLGPVVSVMIPEYGCYLPSMLPIMFKSNANSSPECGFWDYGKKAMRKRGNWSTLGGTYIENVDNDIRFHTCHFSHLTHFALLILELNKTTKKIDTVLNVLIYIGDFLSVSGICGIFVTAIAFKKWRKKQGTIILLNLCLAIILEVLLTELARYTTIVGDCRFLGKFIHYFIISKFAWMLVYSFLQYVRFVNVFTVLPEKIVTISLAFGWGFALIPVSLTAISNTQSYEMVVDSFCYPSGLSLYLGLLMPVSAIILINTFVFFAVMMQVTTKTVESHGNKDNIQKLQMQLATLLFFVLGLPWIFLVLSKFITIYWLGTTLVYIFSLMSNVDGFILFLFYVVFNNETRKFWIKFFTDKSSNTISFSSKISSLRSHQ